MSTLSGLFSTAIERITTAERRPHDRRCQADAEALYTLLLLAWLYELAAHQQRMERAAAPSQAVSNTEHRGQSRGRAPTREAA